MIAPLDGIRVLEVANWVAAPSCAALMADMGADVVKVEPPGGDALRGIVEQPPVESFPGNLTFELDNRGKRSLTVDMERPGGAELVRRLARDVDIFVTGLSKMIVDFGQQFVLVEDIFHRDLRNRVVSEDSLGHVDSFLNIIQKLIRF